MTGVSSSMKTTNEVISVILLVICLVITPIVFLFYLKNHLNIYQMSKFVNTNGSLFEDIDLRTKW